MLPGAVLFRWVLSHTSDLATLLFSPFIATHVCKTNTRFYCLFIHVAILSHACLENTHTLWQASWQAIQLPTLWLSGWMGVVFLPVSVQNEWVEARE